MRLIEDQPIFAEHHLKNLQNFFSSPDILNNGLFVTLRHSKLRRGKNDKAIWPLEYFTDTAVEDNWRYFLKRLNSKVLNKSYKKYGNRLQHISVEHKHPTNRFLNHIHTILVKPAYMAMSSFTETIIDCWNSTPFGTTGYRESDGQKRSHDMFAIRKLYSSGVIKYQFRDTPNYDPYTLGVHIHS